MKSPIPYWNPLDTDQQEKWQSIPELEKFATFITLSEDPETGNYTRLTRFLPGTDTSAMGVQSHPYVEEIYILEGSLWDAAQNCALRKGHYACRPPGEKHGPFKTDEGCLVLEVSYPGDAS